jgi:hypothetical protein
MKEKLWSPLRMRDDKPTTSNTDHEKSISEDKRNTLTVRIKNDTIYSLFTHPNKTPSLTDIFNKIIALVLFSPRSELIKS